MGAKKTKTTSANTYDYKAPPTNQYYQNANSLLENIDFTSDVNNAFGQADNEIRESGNDLFGAETSPEVRERSQQSRLFRNKIERGKAMSSARQAENNAKITGNMALGDAHKAQLVQTGGTTTQITPNSFMDWMRLGMGGISAGSSLASALSRSSGGIDSAYSAGAALASPVPAAM